MDELDNDLKERIKGQLVLIWDVMNSPEYMDSLAEFAWNLFTKLQAKGIW